MRTVMITGADSGLGFHTARKIAENAGNRVILACRNQQKADAARRRIVEETGNPLIEVSLVNVAMLDSIRALAERFAETGDELDVLIDNAGISQRFKGTADDGFELVFEANYLGPFFLTLLMLPHISERGRIIVVVDEMRNAGEDGEELHWMGAEYLAYRAKDDTLRYAYSKLCDLMFAYELARKLKDAGSSITANAFDPGFMAATGLYSINGIEALREKRIAAEFPDRYSTVEISSTALAELALSPAFAGVSGMYFDREKGTRSTSELSYDKDIRQQLWQSSLKMLEMEEPDVLRPTFLSRMRMRFFGS